MVVDGYCSLFYLLNENVDEDFKHSVILTFVGILGTSVLIIFMIEHNKHILQIIIIWNTTKDNDNYNVS